VRLDCYVPVGTKVIQDVRHFRVILLFLQESNFLNHATRELMGTVVDEGPLVAI
jgi:hypothetical protein